MNSSIRTALYPYLEQEDHALPKGLEVVHVVQAALVLAVHEERHPKNRENEHD